LANALVFPTGPVLFYPFYVNSFDPPLGPVSKFFSPPDFLCPSVNPTLFFGHFSVAFFFPGPNHLITRRSDPCLNWTPPYRGPACVFFSLSHDLLSTFCDNLFFFFARFLLSLHFFCILSSQCDQTPFLRFSPFSQAF